ncbi:MAG: restriction endonuclease subunit S [Rothia sp.]|uniref:restriction endonuclease subunit S n=1 Tax=Rothia sp. (in: high G+C Gram-positive bacteria) TaxID=1885016 RepID=UPI001CB34CAD|nr:restriction endonuclease subunit S [Rothia sp. (in: high G+C Gram-positive bacteria)]MBF1681203.1 restriction endonuclease subunit S [Rothia sp. (in: high G+C Gram-positive bacteria)]
MAVLSDAQREAGWTVAKLGDIATLVMGTSPKSSDVVDYPLGMPLLNGPAEFTDKYPVPVKWTEKGIRFSEPGDILFCVRATLGKMNFSDQRYAIGRGLAAIRGKDKLHTRYIYYTLISTMESILRNANGTIYLSVTKSDVENFDIPIPPQDVLERIAGILGSLDDKIEANTRLIQTLLDTADSVFQKFYSECELSESTYASLEVYGGGTPSTKNETYWGGDIHWLTPTDVTSLGSPILFETARKLTEDGLNACSSKLHPAGSIMMTSRATIGAFAINQYPAATNQGFIVAVPQREEERWWIYHHMKKDVPEMINSANGTTFLEISRRTFKGLPYSSLSYEDLDRFHAVINPLYELVKSSEQENLQLAATRDALIKRLIG